MAELEQGILGRHLDFDIKINETEAIIRSDDIGSKKHDIDLYEETKDYDIDDSRDPAYVTIDLLDGESIIVSMNNRELKIFTETVDSAISRRRQREFLEKHPGVSKGLSIVTKVLFGIAAVIFIILALTFLFGK